MLYNCLISKDDTKGFAENFFQFFLSLFFQFVNCNYILNNVPQQFRIYVSRIL